MTLPKRRPCRNCNADRVLVRLRLCWSCYHTLAIREMYAPETPREKAGATVYGDREEPQTPRPEWQQGEPRWRCTWCFEFRCDGPLRLCEGCQAEYERMAVGMPSVREGSVSVTNSEYGE